MNSFFERLCGGSAREHGEVNQSPVKPSQFTRMVSLSSLLETLVLFSRVFSVPSVLGGLEFAWRSRVVSGFLRQVASVCSSLSVFSSCLELSRAKWPQRARVSRFWAPGRGYGQNELQNARLEHFGWPAPDRGKSGPEGSFREPGRKYGQKATQQAHFDNFGSLAANMGKRPPRRLIWSTLGARLQIWAKPCF